MHRFANPARFLGIAKPLTPLLLWAGLVLAIGACAWGLTMVPAERLQGHSVKIIFAHVPAAWLGMAGWTGIAIASIIQLVWLHPLAGVSARAIAVPGAMFAALCLLPGSIWGRPSWGGLVVMGLPFVVVSRPLFPLSRLYRACQCIERKRQCQPHGCRFRDHRCR